MKGLTERQVSAVKKIYDSCIWFLYEFERSDGFNAYWEELKDETKMYEMVDGLLNKVHLVLEQEYFDLRNCDIYDELCEFVAEDLLNVYDGKLGYAYRFESIADDNFTTQMDYDKAMIHLNNIIEKYV